MKFLKLKSILFSLITIAMVTVFLTSCEKNNSQQDDYLSEINLEDAPFKKEVVTKNDDGAFIFEISSNNEKIMNSINENTVSFTFLDENELNELPQRGTMIEQTDDQSESQVNEDESLEGRPYIGISLTKMITSDEDINEIPPYKLQLDQSILKVIKELKAVTVFDFQPDVEINSVIQNRVNLWSNNKKVGILGDCGYTKTRTRNYWAYYGQSKTAGQLSSSHFKCDSWISACCKGSNSSYGSNSGWVRKVIVTQDVAPSIFGSSNSCHGNSDCYNFQSNSCTGYYPYGCMH